MAQYSEANSKTQAAAIATALTLIWGDTVDTRVNLKLVNPQHPMRQLLKMLNFNPLTGVVTANDSYITNAYAGKKEPKSSNNFDIMARPTAALSTATVENGDKSKIVVTYDMVLDTTNAMATGDWSFVTDGTPATVSTVTISGATVSIDTNADFANGDVITVSYTPGAHPLQAPNGNDVLALALQVVTNNVV